MEVIVNNYKQNGFAKVEGFFSSDEIESMRNEISKLAEEERTCFDGKLDRSFNFTSDYFLTSGDTIRWFYGITIPGLDTGPKNDPNQGLVLVGHAIHSKNPTFKKVTCDEKFKKLFEALGYVEPTVMQSLILIRNPKDCCDCVPPHRDSQTICTSPDSLLGIWIALDDIGAGEGCILLKPGSHLNETEENNNSCEDRERTDLVSIPAKKGDIVLLNGLTLHKSEPNKSSQVKWIYGFYVYDKSKSELSKSNLPPIGEDQTLMPVFAP